MDIIINYWAVLVCGIVAMVLGFIWYGPIFGKLWMKLNGVDAMNAEQCKEMQKKAGPMYGVQFVLALFQAYVLAYFIGAWLQFQQVSGIHTAFGIWIGFIMTTIASTSLWTGETGKAKWARFLVQSGYNLILFIIFGLILGMWR